MGNLFRHTASVGLLTLISRILGVVRDAAIAWALGSSMISDAFFLAFRPFDLLRKLFSEGILSLSFVPEFCAYLARGKRDEAMAMFWSALLVVCLAGSILGAAAFYAAPYLTSLLAPESWGTSLMISGMFRMMLPYGVVVLALAVCMGGMNALGSFKGPAATPILLNICMILVVILLPHDPWMLAVGVTLGGLLQLLFQVPLLVRSGIRRPSRFVFFHPGVIRSGRRFFPFMIGASGFQVNLLVSALIASTLAEGGISRLYFAERLVQFPLALLVTSVATVFLPALSGASATNAWEGRFPAIEDGAKMVMFMTMGAMGGIMALDRHIVGLLFGRGAFDPQAVHQTATCLFYLVSGLWAMAGYRIFVTCHFAVSDFRLPLVASGVSMLAHLVLAMLLKTWFGVPGLALALALGAICGFAVLAIFSTKGPAIKGMMVSACRALGVSGIMACLVRWTADAVMPDQGPLIYRAAALLAVIGFGIAIFLVTAACLARPEMTILKKVLIQPPCPDLKK